MQFTIKCKYPLGLHSDDKYVLASCTFSDVEIEEVAVENGLDDAGDNGDDVEAVLVVIAVDPVEDIEAAVGA